MQLKWAKLEPASSLRLGAQTASTRRSLGTVQLGESFCSRKEKYFSDFWILQGKKFQLRNTNDIFSGRKSAEAVSFVYLCQRPVLRGPSATGSIPVDLDHFTSFGTWICDQVVLHTHQKVSKLPMYAELDAEIPQICFRFIEDLAICFRPFQHPEYYQGFRWLDLW